MATLHAARHPASGARKNTNQKRALTPKSQINARAVRTTPAHAGVEHRYCLSTSAPAGTVKWKVDAGSEGWAAG
jgi:hypothetical protein